MDTDFLYIDEHTSCGHYVADRHSYFKSEKTRAADVYDFVDRQHNRLMFFIDGEAKISCNEFTDKPFKKGDVILLPKSARVVFRSVTDCHTLSSIFDVPKNTCDKLNFQSYWQLCEQYAYDFSPLRIGEPMKRFLDLLIYFLDYDINCEHFHEIKQQEMFLIFKWFYTREELARLFYPMIGKSMNFKALVLENYLKVANVEELAKLSNMGRSNFDARFRKEFGMPARQWVLKQKANHIRYHLAEPSATIGDTMHRFGFNSATHFTRFCKQQFGCTPTELIAKLRSTS